MFPEFRREWIKHVWVHRERLVEPIHPLNSTHLIPSIETPVKNLYLANAAQIYPELTNGESVTRHARKAAGAILAGWGAQGQWVSHGRLAAWHAARRATDVAAEGAPLAVAEGNTRS
jgi:hypothetical protein